MDSTITAPDAAHENGWIADAVSALDITTATSLLRAHQAALTGEIPERIATTLKQRADAALRADLPASERYTQLLFALSEITANPVWRALGLRAQGNIEYIGKREFAKAVSLYDEAAGIYRDLGLVVQEAEALVGKVGALAVIGRYDDAFQTAAWVSRVLEAHERWSQYVTLKLNMGLIYNRLRDDVGALRVFDQAHAANQRLGEQGQPTLMMIQNNRAIHLRNLGRYQEALQAGDMAHALAEQLDYGIEVARIEHNQAYVWTALGNYNRALQLFAGARDAFLNDGRTRDVLMLDADIIECWLHLGRYDRVLDTARQTRPLYARTEAHLEIANVILYESIADMRLGRYGEALDAIDEAVQRFELANSRVNVAVAQLEAAAVLYLQQNYDASMQIAAACMQLFQTLNAPVEYAKACLVGARAAAALGRANDAAFYIDEALMAGSEIPTLTYQAYFLRGVQAEAVAQFQHALDYYDRAIGEIERLRGNVMVEFRSSFVADKQDVFENAAHAAIELGDIERAWRYAEQSKSRALIDVLAYRLNLSIQPHTPVEVDRVAEINTLRTERDRLYRRWETQRSELRREGPAEYETASRDAHQTLLHLERTLTDKWHDLLIRDADYAREGALWQAQPESVQPWLDRDTVLLEYFGVGDGYYAFIVTSQGIEVRRLHGHNAEIEGARQKLALNWRAVSASPHMAAALAVNGRKILQQLNQALIAPVQDELLPYKRVVIVPHGQLHGLPMHALHDGESYLLERHEVSYLPSAGVLRFCREPHKTTGGAAIFGCSNEGRLAGTVHEAQIVAARMGGNAYVEAQATRAQLCESAANSRVLHLATHAEFSAHNPLFSFLALNDGTLTALDIYNLRVSASLVTLSACQTGESVIGGGDELYGLTRAFLYAGAASLVLSGWKVNDAFTAEFMDVFYQGLAEGQDKGAALRAAQLAYIHGAPAGTPYAHPQFWAGFHLVGDWGAL